MLILTHGVNSLLTRAVSSVLILTRAVSSLLILTHPSASVTALDVGLRETDN